MSWVKVYIHFVFSTYNREPLLSSPGLRAKVFEHISDNAKAKGIWLDCINGYHDHVHCLVSMGKEISISKIAQLIKGESSYWINKQHLINGKFAWQDDYWAASVSDKNISTIRKYIHNQEEHHRIKSLEEEIKEFYNESM